MFDTHGVDRLTEWKRFRDRLETSPNPLADLAEFWSRAPFVNSYLDENNPTKWPDPWHLVLDERLDDLAIALGMLYTLKLTQRFMPSRFEIHMSMFPEESSDRFYLLVDDNVIYDMDQRKIITDTDFSEKRTTLIWSKDQLS